MPRPRIRSLLAALPALTACHAAPPAEPPQYPPLATATTRAHAEWSEGLQALTLTCAEPELDNGVDDNCDGHIDEGLGGTQGTLEVALTWLGPAKLTLSTHPELDGAPPQVTCTEGATCVARISSQTWSGDEALEVRVRAPEGDSPVRASLSLTALGQPLGTRNVVVPAGETRDLARVATR